MEMKFLIIEGSYDSLDRQMVDLSSTNCITSFITLCFPYIDAYTTQVNPLSQQKQYIAYGFLHSTRMQMVTNFLSITEQYVCTLDDTLSLCTHICTYAKLKQCGPICMGNGVQ